MACPAGPYNPLGVQETSAFSQSPSRESDRGRSYRLASGAANGLYSIHNGLSVCEHRQTKYENRVPRGRGMAMLFVTQEHKHATHTHMPPSWRAGNPAPAAFNAISCALNRLAVHHVMDEKWGALYRE